MSTTAKNKRTAVEAAARIILADRLAEITG